MTSAPEFLTYWYNALNSPLGWGIRTSDPVRVKQLLYSARTAANDPSLAHLQIRTSPLDPTGELWIVHGERS